MVCEKRIVCNNTIDPFTHFLNEGLHKNIGSYHIKYIFVIFISCYHCQSHNGLNCVKLIHFQSLHHTTCQFRFLFFPLIPIFVQSKRGDSSSETSLPARGGDPTPWSKDWELMAFTDYLGKSQLNEWAPEAKKVAAWSKQSCSQLTAADQTLALGLSIS